MKFPTVLLLLATVAVMLEYSYAVPASFGDDERKGEHDERKGEHDERKGELSLQKRQTGANLGIALGNIGGFLTTSAALGTNCVSRDCFIDPFNLPRCLTCLALTILGGLGK